MMQYFCILTKALNCSSCGNDLPPHTTLTTLSIDVVSDGSKSSNYLEFCGKNTNCLQTLLYNLELKLLLGLSFKIVITRYVCTIMASSADVRHSNILG